MTQTTSEQIRGMVTERIAVERFRDFSEYFFVQLPIFLITDNQILSIYTTCFLT